MIQCSLMFVQKKSIAKELSKVPRASGAGYDSGRSNAPDRCFKGPRTAILKTIRDWLDQPISESGNPIEPIYWINGIAGIGKSTIARTVAEDEGRRKCLGASFFFSHQEKDLSDPKLFIPTIAHQLAQSYPEVRLGVCHGTTSLLSFLIFVCPPPHLHHLPTPSDLVHLPSTASAPTLRCTHATMLRPCSD